MWNASGCSTEPEQDSGSAIEQSIYSKDATNRTYEHLEDITRKIILADFSVIVDASFLKLMHRDQFKLLALKNNAPFIILSCYADEEVLSDRIRQRMESQHDPSEANLAVLQHQLQTQEEFTSEERNGVKIITSTEPTLNPDQLQTLMLHIRAPKAA
jgi:hypothetical protein